MKHLKNPDDIKAYLRSFGLIPGFRIQPLKRKYLSAHGIEVPEIIAEYLSQLDKPEIEQRDDGGLIWRYEIDPLVMKERDVYLPDLFERFHRPIRDIGGDVVDLPGEQQFCLIYPRSILLMRSFFAEAGLGIDCYVPIETGKLRDPSINSPERVKARLDDALALFDEMNASQPVVLTQISQTSARVETLTPPERKWADAWAARVWDYYVKHKSEASDERAFDPVHSYSKKECFRQARKFGAFAIGG